jgi:hypothetical protein
MSYIYIYMLETSVYIMNRYNVMYRYRLIGIGTHECSM